MQNSTSAEIDSYIDQLRTPGEYDSEGHFTVSGLRAVGKLAQFLLEKEADWILKLVQCACSAQCGEIRIDQTRNATQIHMTLPYPVKLKDFEKNLITTENSGEQPGLNDLTAALRGVGIGQKRSWVTKLVSRSEVSLISCDGAQVSADTLPAHTSVGDVTEVTIGVSYPDGQAGKLGGLIRFGEAIQREHQALLTRARCCPIPIALDGKRLDDLTLENEGLETRAFLGLYGPADEGSDTLAIPRAVVRNPGFRLQDRFASGAAYYVVMLPEGRARAIQCWYFNYTRWQETLRKGDVQFQPVPAPSRVHLVRKGVVVGTRLLGFNHPVSVEIYLQADTLNSDLTGLKVVVTDDVLDRAKDEIRRSVNFLDGLSASLRKHSPKPQKRDLLLYGGLGALGLFLPTLAVKAVAGTVATVLLAKAAHNHGKIVKECTKQVEDFRDAWSW